MLALFALLSLTVPQEHALREVLIDSDVTALELHLGGGPSVTAFYPGAPTTPSALA